MGYTITLNIRILKHVSLTFTYSSDKNVQIVVPSYTFNRQLATGFLVTFN